MYRMLSRCRRSLLGSFALALVSASCSSESSDTDGVPLWNAANAPAPGGVGGPAPGASNAADPVGSADPGGASTAGSVPEGAESSASESPVTPDLPLGTQGSSGVGAAGSGGVDDGSAGAAGAAMATAGAGGSAPEGEPAAVDPDGVATDGPAPRPSAVCGTGGGAPSFNLPNTIVSVPASYDGSTPLPVVMAFHAAGNPNTQLQGILDGALQNDYIVFYPKSDGNGWSDGADSPKVDAIFRALDGAACYDQSRVFATGHSSGAHVCARERRAGVRSPRWLRRCTVRRGSRSLPW